MSTIRCECGQVLLKTMFDGRPRRKCPVCHQSLHPGEPIMAELVEPIDAVIMPSSAIVPQTSHGIWRDGNVVVVDLSNYQFPPRCVHTNAPVPLPLEMLELSYLPNRRAWSLFGGSIGRVIGQAVAGETTLVKLGISSEWKRRDRTRKTIAWLLLFIGWPGLAVVSAASRGLPSEAHGITDALAALLFFIAIAAIILLAIYYRRTVHVSALDSRFVRLRGMGRDFINALPAWNDGDARKHQTL